MRSAQSTLLPRRPVALQVACLPTQLFACMSTPTTFYGLQQQCDRQQWPVVTNGPCAGVMCRFPAAAYGRASVPRHGNRLNLVLRWWSHKIRAPCTAESQCRGRLPGESPGLLCVRGKPDDSWAVWYCGITCPHLRQGLRAVFAFCTSPPHTLLPAETALRSDLFPFLPWHTAGTQVWLCDQVTCAPSHSLSSLSTRYLQRSQKRSPLWDGHGTGWKQPGA